MTKPKTATTPQSISLGPELAGVAVEQAADAVGAGLLRPISSRTTPFQPAPYLPLAKMPTEIRPTGR